MENMGEKIKPVQCNHFLALRGMLACGLLVHCFSRRHRVDYAGSTSAAWHYPASCGGALPWQQYPVRSRRVRARYTPNDKLIMLTLLLYYHDGLTRDQIKEATRTLLALGPQAQEAEYTLWLSSASQMINDEQRQALDSVDKLDLTSEPQQLDMLFTLCKYNMAAVNFWLNSCVLPRETMQFPNRLWPTRST